MSIRREALKWLKNNYPKERMPVATSKFYKPEESWPKTKVWWLVIPPESIDAKSYDHVNLICQKRPTENDFYYFRVPTAFLTEHLGKFHRMGQKLSLYLSAEQQNLYREVRGEGFLDFRKFLIEK